jgi:RNA polymerase sigma-70 factor (ECF subfamily)
MPDGPEDDLVERCLRSESGAFAELYRREVGGVYHLLLRMTGDRAEAEDLTQECFVSVHLRLRQFRGSSAVRTWIKRIAINLALGYLRRERPLLFDPQEHDFSAAITTQSAQPTDMGEVHRAILALPEGSRVVLTLHLLEGYRQTEIADILGVSLGTVKSQYWRAKHLLREALQTKSKCNG